MHAKFEVSSFNRSRNMEGPKISKVGHVTPSFDVILHCFDYAAYTDLLSVKFDTNIFIGDRYMADMAAKCPFPPIGGVIFWGLTP